MNGPGLAAVTSLLVVLVVALQAPPARAGSSPDQCIEANNKAQSFRRAGQFASARAELTTCADTACPRLVRSDCVQRLDELDRAQPAVVFDVKDADGTDMVAVKVRLDGRLLAETVTGTALPADPGEHVFTFETAGRATVTRTFVLKEGDRSRRERIVFPAPAGVTPSTTAALPALSPATTPAGTSPVRVFGFAAGGVGVAGVAVGVVFGLLASSANSAQKSDCESLSSCSNHGQAVSEHNTLETDGTIATTAFIAGGALLLTGGALILLGKSPSPDGTSALIVAPGVGPGSAGFALRGRF